MTENHLAHVRTSWSAVDIIIIGIITRARKYNNDWVYYYYYILYEQSVAVVCVKTGWKLSEAHKNTKFMVMQYGLL